MKNSMFTFGHGKYNCMGKNISKMEMYKVIPTLIKKFTVSKYCKAPIPVESKLKLIDF